MYLRPNRVMLLTLALTACAPTHQAAPTSAAAAKAPAIQAEVEAATSASPTPSGAMGKRAAPQPGEQVSPVIAFRGHAEHWSIQVENTGAYAHAVDFTWGSGSQHATGSLQYQPQSGAVAGAPILLEGGLETAAGRRAMRVEITPAACTDDADQAYPQSVQVTVEGMAPMLGCGELAK
jgi:hypothetical protein